ncbi:hypothetical protein T11_1569 [Trichinella zimbabwensis]|uniref:Uncharacterized protein n=1 Tax=Trichinella zimbabwensis TaxID=268475 RepID=A0A0V1HYI3_9BILA|nr:hypothetical protein T11_1569 [Trichinella zimbabwensis]
MVEVLLVRLLTTARRVMDSVTVFDDKGQLFRIGLQELVSFGIPDLITFTTSPNQNRLQKPVNVICRCGCLTFNSLSSELIFWALSRKALEILFFMNLCLMFCESKDDGCGEQAVFLMTETSSLTATHVNLAFDSLK